MWDWTSSNPTMPLAPTPLAVTLHSIAPLLVPSECMEDITIEGYYTLKESYAMVNICAIRHDSKVWSSNVEHFYPKRFIKRHIDLRGHHFDTFSLFHLGWVI